jgi:hypothetical protein
VQAFAASIPQKPSSTHRVAVTITESDPPSSECVAVPMTSLYAHGSVTIAVGLVEVDLQRQL